MLDTASSINPIVCLSKSRDEWVVIRECYVKSFFTYPLYKYIEPDQVKREKFLRAYMDANYDVTVGSGQGIVLAVRIPDENQTQEPDVEKKMKTVGGALLVPPSSSGCGWAVESDEPYWEAYEKYGLRKISEEAFERVKRYENWENENLAQKATRTRIPLWNGLFCAIEPEYASKGLGSAVYKKGVKIMASHWFKLKQKSQKNEQKSPNLSTPKPDQDKPLRALMRSFSCHPPRLGNFTFEKSLSQDALLERKHFQKAQLETLRAPLKPIKNQTSVEEAPLAIVISHSDRAAHFHRANGFHPITKIPFYDPVEETTPFTTHILVLDPFRTGRIEEFMTELNDAKTVSQNTEPLQENSISFAAI